MTQSIDHLEKIYEKYDFNYLIKPHCNIFQPQTSTTQCVMGAYLAQRTQLMCWLREKRNFCLWTVQTLMVLSSEAVTRVCPSPEKLTLRTEAVWALKDVDSAFLYVHISTGTTIKLICFLFYAGRNKEHVPTNPSMENMLALNWKSNVWLTDWAPTDVQSCLWMKRPPGVRREKTGPTGLHLCVH